MPAMPTEHLDRKGQPQIPMTLYTVIPTRCVRYPKEIFFENLQPGPQSEGCNNALRHFFLIRLESTPD